MQFFSFFSLGHSFNKKASTYIFMGKLTFCKLMSVNVGRIKVSVQKEIQNIIKHFNPANIIFYIVLTHTSFHHPRIYMGKVRELKISNSAHFYNIPLG